MFFFYHNLIQMLIGVPSNAREVKLIQKDKSPIRVRIQLNFVMFSSHKYPWEIRILFLTAPAIS